MKKKIIIPIIIFVITSIFSGCVKIDIDGNPSEDGNGSIIGDNNNDSDINKPDSGDNDLDPDNIKPPVEEPDNEVEKKVRVYYYDVMEDKIIYTDTNVIVKDKAIINALVDALKNPNDDDITPAINSEIYVKTAIKDERSKRLTVNFTENFVKAQNLGSGPEASTLQAIVNTLGYNLGVDNVIIKIDGKPYESGHILMKDGESFKVNYDKTSPIK